MRSFLMIGSLILSAIVTAACAAPHWRTKAASPQADVAYAPDTSLAMGGQLKERISPAAMESEAPRALKAISANGDSEGTPQSASPVVTPSDRMIIYTASMILRVPNIAQARQAIDGLIKKHQGVLVQASLDQVTFRVPPAQLDATLADLSALGEVAARNINSEDVTSQFRDLGLRLEVAEGSRKRLMDLMAKAGAVKDVLEVERDIRRLTEEIEQMKGSIRAMKEQVDLSRIEVRLEQKALQQFPPRHRAQSMFAWINQVGMDRVLEPVSSSAPLKGDGTLATFFWGPHFRLATPKATRVPAGFALLLDNGQQLVAATPEDNRLRVQWFSTRQSQDLEFWTRALVDELKAYRGYTIASQDKFAMDRPGQRSVVLHCETQLAGETWAYDVWLIQSEDSPKDLYVAEFARPKKQASEGIKEIESAVRGIRLR